MTLVEFDKVSPVLQVISQEIYGIWRISLHSVKNPPNLQCTLYSVHRIHGVTLQKHQQHAKSGIPSTLYHEWTRSHKLRIMNARSHINYVPWMDAVTPTLYHECTHSWYRVNARIHGTELMRFGEVTLGSTKISIQWLWPVKMTLEVIKRRLMVFLLILWWRPFKKRNIKNIRASSLPVGPPSQMVGQCL